MPPNRFTPSQPLFLLDGRFLLLTVLIRRFRPRGYKTQLSMKISLLINMKMTVGIFIFYSREVFMLSYVFQERIAIVDNWRFND